MKTDSAVEKKKIQLPLFGKKKTFGFDKLKQQVSSHKSTTSEETKTNENKPIEEFDDDDDDNNDDDGATKHTVVDEEKAVDLTFKKSPKIELSKVEKSCDEQINEFNSKIDTEQIETKENKNKVDSSDHLKHENPKHLPAEEKVVENSSGSSASTKNRSKHRNRNKARQQIDIDETEEEKSPQKYSGWVPPSNQSGDGITDLNSKYGY